MRQADKPTSRQADKPTSRQADKPTSRQADKPTSRQADKPTSRQADKPTSRQADKPTSRQADKPTSRQADKPTSRQADKPTSRQADKPTSGNRILSAAKKAKQDEFYTQLNDISAELRHYKKQLRGKVIFCNCDDPFESNFFKYFAANFNSLGLKKLIATSYKPSPITGGELPLFDIEGSKGKEPYVVEINEVPDMNNDGAINLDDVRIILKRNKKASRPLHGDGTYGAGDFRSAECVELLKQADIVVTNPPFSLFREYVAQLVEYDKNFLIVGNKNAITYKEIFKLIKDNKLWAGVRPFSGGMWFIADYTGKYEKIVGGVKLINVPAIWLTNMDNPKRHEEIPLYKKYTRKEYPKYDNYNAIEVSKTADIPVDYDGAMGVPITFLDKYNPDQFEILGMCENKDIYGLKSRIYTTKECKDAYFKHFGKKGTYDLNAAGVIDGKKVYQRLLIKRK